jgi:hypothetical protein
MRLVITVLLIAGLTAIATGAVLLGVLSPHLDRLYAGYKYSETFEGTYNMAKSPTGELTGYPVVLEREREVTSSRGRRCVIEEVLTTTSASEWPPLSVAMSPVEETDWVVDCANWLPLPQTDRFMVADEMVRGYISFPPRTQPQREYPVWTPLVQEALPARYESTNEVEGLSVLAFSIHAKDVRVWGDYQAAPLRVADVDVEFMVEPRTGLVINEQSDIVIRVAYYEKGWMDYFISKLKLTENTVSKNVSRAKAERLKILFVGQVLPWVLVGLGAATVTGATMLFAIQRRRIRCATV